MNTTHETPSSREEEIRKDFYLKIAQFSDGNTHVEPYSMQKIADYWLGVLSHERKELREKIEKAHTDTDCCQRDLILALLDQ